MRGPADTAMRETRHRISVHLDPLLSCVFDSACQAIRKAVAGAPSRRVSQRADIGFQMHNLIGTVWNFTKSQWQGGIHQIPYGGDDVAQVRRGARTQVEDPGRLSVDEGGDGFAR